MKMMNFNTQTFSEIVLQSDKPVLVDFWADWCGPCQMLSPVIDELAEDYQDKVIFGKVDIDQEPSLAMQYRIMSIPSVLFFSGGEMIKKAVGVRDKDEYVKYLDEILE